MNGKRILSFILALVMVLGMVPFNALPTFAAEAVPATGWNGDVLEIHNSAAVADCASYFRTLASNINPYIYKATGPFGTDLFLRWNALPDALKNSEDITWVVKLNGSAVTSISASGTYEIRVGVTYGGTTYDVLVTESLEIKVFDVLTINTTVDGTTTTSYEKVYRGSSVTVNVASKNGYAVSVSGAATGTTVGNYTVGNITEDKTLTIAYTKDTDSTVNVTGENITATYDAAVVANGSTNVKIVPAAGYFISGVKLNGSDIVGNYDAAGAFNYTLTVGASKAEYVISVTTAPVLVIAGGNIAYNETMTAAQIVESIFALVNQSASAATVNAYTDIAVQFEYVPTIGNPEWRDLNDENRGKFGEASTERIKVIYKGGENNQYPATTFAAAEIITVNLTEDRQDATYVQNNGTLEVTMNGYYEASALDATAQAALKAAILEAVVGQMNHDGTVTIVAYDGDGVMKGWYDIFNNSANFFVGTETIKIRWTDSSTYTDYETGEITLVVKDSRPNVSLNVTNNTLVTDAMPDEGTLETWFSIPGLNGDVDEAQYVTTTISPAELGEDGVPGSYVVTVNVANNPNSKAGTDTFDVTITNKLWNATITGAAEHATVTVKDSEGNVVVAGAEVAPGQYTVVVDPEDGYFVNGLNGVAVVEGSESWDGNTYSATIEVSGGADALNNVSFTADVQKMELTHTSDSYTISAPASAATDAGKFAALLETIYNEVLTNESVYAYDGNLVSMSLTQSDIQENTPVAVTITRAATDKYPAAEITVNVTFRFERSDCTIEVTAPVVTIEENLDEVLDAINVNTNGVAYTKEVVGGTLPKQGEPGTVTVKITTVQTDSYNATTKEFTIDVVGAVTDALIKVESGANGTLTVNGSVDNFTIHTNGAEMQISVVAAPNTNKPYYVNEVKFGAEVINGTQNTLIFEGNVTVKDGTGLELGVQPVYTVSASFAEATLMPNASASVSVNKNKTAKLDKEVVAGIKTRILDALFGAGNYDADDFMIKTQVGVGNIQGIVVVEDDSVAVNAPGNYLDGADARGALAWELSKNSYSFTITKKADGKIPAIVLENVSVAFPDSRPKAVISVGDDKTLDFDLKEEIDAYIAGLVSATYGGADIADSAISMNYDLTGIQTGAAYDGTAQTVTVTVNVAETVNYQAADPVSFTLEVTGIEHHAQVNVQNDAEAGTVAGLNGSYDFNDANEVTFTVDPNGEYYVKSVLVNNVIVNGTYSGTVFTGKVSLQNGESAANVYEIQVEYGTREVNVANTSVTINEYSATKLADVFAAAGVTANGYADTDFVTVDNGDGTYTITLPETDMYPAVSRVITVTETDNRLERPVTLSTSGLVINTLAGLEDAIRNAVNVTTNTTAYTVIVDAADLAAAMNLKQGQTVQVTVTVKADGNTLYLDYTGTIEVPVTGQVNDATVTIIVNGNGTASYDAGTQNLTMVPESGWFVDKITVNGTVSDVERYETSAHALPNGSNMELGVVPGYDVIVVFCQPSIVIADSAEMTYYINMPDQSVSKLNELAMSALNSNGGSVIYNPSTMNPLDTQVKYQARANGTAEFPLMEFVVAYNAQAEDDKKIPSLILERLPETIDLPVTEAWELVNVQFTPAVMPEYEDIKDDIDALFEKAIDVAMENLTNNPVNAVLNAVKDDLMAIPEVQQYLVNFGAHEFGDSPVKDANQNPIEKVRLENGTVISNVCEMTLLDNRAATHIVLNEGVAVKYNSYTTEDLLNLLVDGVYAGNTKIENATVTMENNVVGMPVGEQVRVVISYAGDPDLYKPCEVVGYITIEKAPLTLSVDNRWFKYPASLDYELSDVIITKSNGVVVDAETINFIAGLDIDEVNIDGGLKGLEGKIQLMLPEGLQSMLVAAENLLKDYGLNISFRDGASMKLSDLQKAVDALDGAFAGTDYEEYFRVLLNVLKSLPTDVADITIVLGGEVPTDIGAYVVGAISADANYETAYGVGAIVITPDGTKVDLAWNQNDDNYIVTNSLLANNLFDTGATAFVPGTTDVHAAATEQVVELFLGLNIDELDNELKGLVIEFDQSKLGVGAYVEVALISDFGNEMYYAMPIARPIVVVAETLNVDFRDDSGNVNNERHFEFFNVAQDAMEKNLLVTYKKDGNGYKAGDEVTDYSVKFFYVGVQTNGKPYASTQAPVHAGVYTITAVVTLRDASGAITHAGQGIGALVIEPSKSTIDVENEAIKWDGSEHNFNQYVHADSVNTDLIPDTTVITVGISADLNANIGLDAIEGTFNVDLPAWMDELMKKLGILEAGYTDAGITVAQFKTYVQKLEEAMAELGVDSAAFDKVIDVIGQLSDKATLTFHDDKGYTDIGAYLVIGIVTDSDHWPSADAGIVVIYPDGEKAELKYAETWDDNNVFTWNVLQHYDLNAEAYLKGEFSQDLTDKTLNLFVGFADHGELILTKNKAELDNGIYAEVSFLLILDNTMYYAEPIAREVIIVPNPADVDFLDDAGNVNNDRHFQFTNQAHAMGKIQVVLADGTKLVLDAGDDRLDILYVGVQLNGKPYASAEAPVHAGVYEVTAQYTERKDGKVYNLGIGIGMLVIEPSKSETVVDNGAYPYGETHHVNDLVHVSSVNVPSITPDATVISAGLSADLDTISGLSSINGTVNVDLPAWMDDILNKLNILDAGYADGISRETFLSYVERIESGLKELGVETDAFAEITNVIKQLPVNTNLTFQDNIGYSEIGAYLIIAVVTDSDHYPSVGAGVMVIYPDATKAELRFEEDWNGNNIFTWSALQSMNLEAMAYVNGVESVEASKYVTNLYVGFTSDGTVMLEAVSYGEHVKDLPEFKNGVYSQIAVLLDLGNQLYYAEPISRAFMIVPTPANIEFVGENVFTFDNQPHALDVQVTINGAVVTDLSGLDVHYTGIMTNGKTYASNEAPTHAGVYVVTASYTVRDEHDRLVTLGVAVGSLVIKPAKAEIDVTNKTHEYDGNGVSVQDMVIATSPVAGLTPDHIVISAGIKANAVLDGNLLNAINGTVNIDLPDWADRLLSQVNGTQDGITVAGVLNAIEAVEAKIEELAAETGVTVDVDAFDGLKKVLAQLDPAFTVSFNENAAYQEVGAYLVVGVVADANHMPAMDAGVLVIYPDVDQAELHWKYEDSNNIFTLDTLAHVDLGAYATVNGAESDAVPFQVLYLGVNANTMEIVLTRDQAELTVGNYTEFAYVLDIGSQMYVAEPIVRNLTIVQNMYEVQANDATFTYDGTGKVVEMIAALNQAGQDISDKGQVFVNYMGLTYGLDGYMSQTAPVNAGQYKAVITFVTYDDQGFLSGVGSKVVNLTINRADPDFDVQDAEFTFDGTEKEHGLVNDHGVDYIAVIETEDGVNLMMTAGLQKLADFLDDKATYDLTELKEAIEKAIQVVEGLELNSAFVDEVLKTIENINSSLIYKITVNGANPVDAGTYKAYAITVPTANYDMDVSQGALVIEPKEVTITVADETITAGETPKLNYTVDGLVNGDDLNVIVTVDGDYSVSGTYDIIATYTADPNYDVTVVNGKLTVEEKQITIGTINFVGPSLNLESEVHYNFDFTLNGFDMNEVVEIGLLRFYTRTDDVTDSTINTADEVTTGYELVDGAYRVRSNGIPAKNLGDDGWYRFYVKMSDGTYVYSNRYKYSAKIYADTVLAGNKYTDDLKALCVTLMNYGAAAQEFFAETTNYEYETLMNAHLSTEDLARVAAYTDDMIDERLNFDSSKHGEFATSDLNVFPNGYNSHLTLLGAITYNFTIDYVAPAGSESGLLIWNQETYENEVLTWENAVKYVMDPNRPIEVAYTGNAAKDMGDTIFACGYVLIDGEYHYTGVFRTSVDNYAKKIIASDNYVDSMHELAKYMVVYGEYAKNYFIKN